MSLHLDARHRAMLQEMGVPVWVPSLPSASQSHPAEDFAPPTPTAIPLTVRALPAPPPIHPHPVAARRAATSASPTGNTATVPSATLLTKDAIASTLRLHPPQMLYHSAVSTATPPELGHSWLIVTESANPSSPLEGDAGHLLDNMLRAMRLHLHPQVFFSALERLGPGHVTSGDMPRIFAGSVMSMKPSMVLILGHVAARAVLGRAEPLGRLRAAPHQLAGYPCAVTYDPAFLLRSQEAKAAAWSDLCNALATVRAKYLTV